MTASLRIFVFSICFFLWSYAFATFPPMNARAQDPTTDDAEHVLILSALETMSAEIHLAPYRKTPAEVLLTYRRLLESTPHLYHVAPAVSYRYDGDGYLLDLYPQYTMSVSEYQTSKAVWADFLDDLVSEMDPALSDADKALWIHDLLASRYTYSPHGEENYDAYSLLTEGHGVCQAFSLTFMAIGRAVGLETDMVTSEVMDHAWNHVRIGEQNYHIDVTRDLPTEEAPLSHERFLLCDEAMKAYGYFGYGCGSAHVCDSHAFDAPNSTEQHKGVLADTINTLFAEPYQLSLQRDGSLQLWDLRVETPPNERHREVIDLDGDGRLSLTDVLLPMIQDAPEEKKTVTNTLRRLLLEEVLSENEAA